MMLEKFVMLEGIFGGKNQNPDGSIPDYTDPQGNTVGKINPKDPDSCNPPKDKGKEKIGETSKKFPPSDRHKRANPANQPHKKKKATNASGQGL
uniref:Uncharacterized protein n=1 Tax=Cannabis sativa TaxID=3483 RepID=A0A803QB29_CANSA